MGELHSAEIKLRHKVFKRGDVSMRRQGLHGNATPQPQWRLGGVTGAAWGVRGAQQHRPSDLMLPLPQMRKPRLGYGP